jgi:glycosyltransferase involved in cell wall biosynthesis
MIVGLFTELAAAGGVQRAGRLTAAVLASFAARRNETCCFLSLNDARETPPLRIGSQEIVFAGFCRSKKRFFQAAWNAARKQPSLVVALHPHLAPVVAAMNVFAPHARTVIFAHGMEVWTPLPFIRRRSLQLADLVFAPSTDTVRQLATQQGLPSAKVRRLPWSVGPEFDFGVPRSHNSHLPEDFPRGRVILTVGRWDACEAYKGVDHLIMALPRLLETMPDLHVVAIGSGSDVPRLVGLAQQNSVAARVHFLSSMPQENLWSAYDFCDVFALPSRGEGFGLVFLEAMAFGKPVIGGAHGGTPDIIEDGVTGYLVRYGDVEQLTDCLQRLLTDDAARSSMGARACERVRRDFSFDRFSRDLAATLESLLVHS